MINKIDIERQIRGYIGLRKLAEYKNEKETVEKFTKLINDLKVELIKYK